MAHNVVEWTASLFQQMPVGVIWPRDTDSHLYRYVSGYAPRLSQAESSAEGVLRESRPETTVQMLPDWEQYLGLPECGTGQQTVDARRRAVVEKYRRKGGLQTWSIERQMALLGFAVSVEEVWPHHCLRGCAFPLNPESYRHTLKVVVDHLDPDFATCLDSVDTPLSNGSQGALECAIENLRMAGKSYEIIYR